VNDMKKIIATILCITLIMAPLPLSFAAQDVDEGIAGEYEFDEGIDKEYILDEIIIKFFDRSLFAGREKQYDNEVAKVLRDGLSVITDNVYVVRAEDLSRNPDAIINRFKNSKYVEYVEPNYITEFDATSNDPGYKNLSAVLTAIGAQKGWDIVNKGGPIVAVVDSGIAKHADLPELLPGYSAIANLSPYNDTVGHGTGVAGVIAALGNNSVGTVGMNWKATLLPVKVDDASGNLSVSNIAKGIIWAADNGASVINLSVGTSGDSVTLKSAIDYAFDKGCSIFAASGNDGKNSVVFPARYANVMAVGASSDGTTRATFSNYGPGLGVLAISSYYSTTPAGGYANMSGTSFASPQVAGLASLILALNPYLTNEQVYDLIQRSAKNNAKYNETIGFGVINIGDALSLTLKEASPPKVDATPPVLTLKGDQVMEIEQDARFTEPGYTAIDDTDGDITKNVVVTGSVNVNVPGVYRLEYSISDAAGNKSTATRVVEVVQVVYEPPVLTLNGSKAMQINQGDSYTEPGYTATDKLDGDLTKKVSVSGTLDNNKPGTYSLQYKVVNSKDLSASATRTVEVIQTVFDPPTLTLNGAQTMQINQGDRYDDPGYTATDKIDGNITSKVTTTGTVDINKPGTYSLQYKVVNSKDLSASATRAVEVIQVVFDPPVLTLNGSQTMQISQGDSYAEPGYTATDKIDGNLTSKVAVTGTVDGNKPGTYSLQYRVVNSKDLSASATRAVEVIQTVFEAPVLTLNGAKTMQINQGDSYKDPGYTATDKIDGNITNKVTVTGTVDVNKPGTYSLEYKVVNSKDLSATTMRAVEVIQTIFDPPALSLNGLQTIQLTEGDSYVEPGYTATDKLDGDLTKNVTTTGTVDVNKPGTYTLQYRVVNSKNLSATATRAVEVAAKKYPTPPVITLSGSMEVSIYTDEQFTEPGYKAADCLGVDLTSAVKVTNNINSNAKGIYTVNYTVADAGGNTARATRTILITEREAPPPPPSVPTVTIVGSNPIILHLDSGTPYTEQGAIANDEADGDISKNVQITGNVNRNTPGTYMLTYAVTNKAGLRATATREVRILAPTETKLVRTPYNFSGQGKAPVTTTHTGVVTDKAGWMDFNATSIDNKSAITVSVVNARTGAQVFNNKFTAKGGLQFWVDEGTYNVIVTLVEGNGNCKYGISLLTPEEIYTTFDDAEVPLGFPIDLFILYMDYTMQMFIDEDLPYTKQDMYNCMVENDYTYEQMIEFGFTAEELKKLENEIEDAGSSLSESP